MKSFICEFRFTIGPIHCEPPTEDDDSQLSEAIQKLQAVLERHLEGFGYYHMDLEFKDSWEAPSE